MKVPLPVRVGGSCRSTRATRGDPPPVRAGAHLPCPVRPGSPSVRGGARRFGPGALPPLSSGDGQPLPATQDGRTTAGETIHHLRGANSRTAVSISVPPDSCVVLDASPGTPERSGDVARRPLIPTRRSPRTHRARSSSGPPWDRPPPGSIGFPFGKAHGGVAVMARWPTGSAIAIVCDIDTRPWSPQRSVPSSSRVRCVRNGATLG